MISFYDLFNDKKNLFFQKWLDMMKMIANRKLFRHFNKNFWIKKDKKKWIDINKETTVYLSKENDDQIQSICQDFHFGCNLYYVMSEQIKYQIACFSLAVLPTKTHFKNYKTNDLNGERLWIPFCASCNDVQKTRCVGGSVIINERFNFMITEHYLPHHYYDDRQWLICLHCVCIRCDC